MIALNSLYDNFNTTIASLLKIGQNNQPDLEHSKI